MAMTAVLGLLAQAAMQSIPMQIGSAGAKPEAAPATGPADSPEEIAKDAQRDLKDSRFYNKPGATRADYDAAWQDCRLIARGSRTPSGSVPYLYNPALGSPLAAGIGAGIGGAIGAAIVQGQIRRANRRECLLVRGWRLIEVGNGEQARLAAMSDADRQGYFDRIVGARDLTGNKIIQWHNDYAAPRLKPAIAK